MAEEINDESLENLTGTEKSAILMMLLGEDEAAQVLQKLTLGGSALGYRYVLGYWSGSNYSQRST